MVTAPIQYETDESGREWAVFENVPIFDEHKGDDGVVYDKRLLGLIAQNNNRRIEDTGDYVPVVEHHTPEDKDTGKDPAIYGFAGPFKLGKIGRLKPRWSIVARYRIAKEHVKEFLRRPRRSVEIWPEKRPEDRFIDPIACLGSETPRRDLGLIYSRGAKKIRYEMAGASFPGQFNTSATGASPEQNAKEPTMALTPEDIAQIRDALVPTIEMIVSEKLGGAGASQGVDGGGAPPAGGVAAPPADGMVAPPAGEPDGDEVLPEGAGGGEPGGDEGDEDDGEVAKGEFEKFCKRYSLGTDKEDLSGARQYMASMDPASRQRFEKHCAKDEASKTIYSRCCTDAAKATAYTRTAEVEVERYRRERDEASTKYQRLAVKHQRTMAELADARDQLHAANSAIRYSRIDLRLSELEKLGYSFDRKAELDLIAGMPDDMVDSAIKRIEDNYPKVPVGLIGPDRFAKTAPESRSVRYSRAAAEVVERMRGEGKKVDFARVLEWMTANDTDRSPTVEDLGA